MAIGGPGEGSVAVEEGEDLPSSIDQDGGQSTSGGGREKRARLQKLSISITRVPVARTFNATYPKKSQTILYRLL